MHLPPKYFALLLEGLAHAFAEPSGLPIFVSRAAPGFFPNTIPGKTAAKESLERGWLTRVRSEKRGKSSVEIVAITPAGQQFLLEQTDVKPLLEGVQASLQERKRQLEQLTSVIRLAQHDLDTLQARVEALSAKAQTQGMTTAKVSFVDWTQRLSQYLADRQHSRPAEDCPLPELFAQAKTLAPELSVGEFHDGLRRLHADRRIALQPWSGPLHEMPEPGLALMQGHSLAYYACAMHGGENSGQCAVDGGQ